MENHLLWLLWKLPTELCDFLSIFTILGKTLFFSPSKMGVLSIFLQFPFTSFYHSVGYFATILGIPNLFIATQNDCNDYHIFFLSFFFCKTKMSSKSTQQNEEKIDMREFLAVPHNQENNPFAFIPDQLSALHDPKNLDLLYIYGGLKGVAKGLHTDIHEGLNPATSIQSNITLKDITSDTSKLQTATQHIENVHSSSSLSSTTAAHNKESNTADPYAKRTSIFGSNRLPPVKGKNIFQLMWMAFQDKTLILLAVAAVVSLAVGLYEDIAVPEYDAQGNKIAGVKWVEGVAIIIAILIVVLVGSVNDYQKEKQFRKLNAKKDDRIVKVKNINIVFIII